MIHIPPHRKKYFTVLFVATALPFIGSAAASPAERQTVERPAYFAEVGKSSAPTTEANSTVMVASLIAAACLGKLAGLRQTYGRVFSGKNSHLDLT